MHEQNLPISQSTGGQLLFALWEQTSSRRKEMKILGLNMVLLDLMPARGLSFAFGRAKTEPSKKCWGVNSLQCNISSNTWSATAVRTT
jgi:hypothetical protein